MLVLERQDGSAIMGLCTGTPKTYTELTSDFLGDDEPCNRCHLWAFYLASDSIISSFYNVSHCHFLRSGSELEDRI